MDTSFLFIIIGSTLLFVALVAWKLRWLYKKMLQAEQQESDNN